MANRFEITIFGMKDDTEMMKVQDALTAAGIGDGGEEEVGAYLIYGKERSIFIDDPTEIGEAVEIINGLGYETDEDEYEAE